MNLVYWAMPFNDTTDRSQIQIAKFKITKCTDVKGTYDTVVATISPAIVNGEFVTEYIDSTGLKNEWYIIEYQNSSDQTLGKSDPRKGQPTYASAVELAWRLRGRMGDMQLPYCYKDSELLDILQEALMTVDRNKGWDDLNDTKDGESYKTLILWVALHQICLQLATDSAKFYNLAIEGIILNKGDRVAHYTGLSEQYWRKYQEKKDEWKVGEVERSGQIQEGYMTRESGTTGRRTPYIFGLPPVASRLKIGRISAGSVELYWNPSQDPGFYYYIIFRASHPNIQRPLIQDIYDKRIAALYNDVSDQNQLWGNATYPIKMIFRNSVGYWHDYNRGGGITAWGPGSLPLLYPGRPFYYVIATVNKNILMSLSEEEIVTLPALAAPIVYPIYANDGAIEGTCEPSSTVELWKETGGPGVYTKIMETTGYPNYRFVYPMTVGNKFKVRQLFLDLTSAYTAVQTAI